jgi:hypothetical protein
MPRLEDPLGGAFAAAIVTFPCLTNYPSPLSHAVHRARRSTCGPALLKGGCEELHVARAFAYPCSVVRVLIDDPQSKITAIC